MAEIRVPEFGESIIEGTISKWLKQEGDAVSAGDAVVEIETEKVNVEVMAEQSGVLQKIARQAGETVSVGEVIALISAQGASTAKPETIGNQPSLATTATTQGSQQEQKSNSNRRDEGSRQHEEGGELERKETSPSAGREVNVDHATQKSPAMQASPAARKLAREQGIDLEQVRMADPIGRIRKQDLIAPNSSDKAGDIATNKQPTLQTAATSSEHSARTALTLSLQSAPSAQAPSLQSTQPAEEGNSSVAGLEERIPMSRRRLTIARHLVQAQQSAAMLTTFNEVDMTAIMDLRKRRKDSFHEKYHVKLGFMSFFTKAVIGALKAFPLLNAEIDGEDIIMKKHYDIGVAVSTNEGLVVPVVHHADRLSFAEIEREIADLAEKARARKLTMNHLRGGTFTITNGGTFGSLLSTPILNTPQVGILGMHKIQIRPVAIDEVRMENRPMMYTALSYDHRIVDGREAVGFLVKLKELLEDPESLLLEG